MVTVVLHCWSWVLEQEIIQGILEAICTFMGIVLCDAFFEMLYSLQLAISWEDW